MKHSGLKTLFVIALAALAIQACAKKDNSLRARQQEEAAKKVDPTKPVDPSKPADPNAKTGSGTTDTTKTDGTTSTDNGGDPVAKGAARSKTAGAFDAKLTYSETCDNPVKLEASEQGEEKVSVEDLLAGGKTFKVELGKYQLTNMDVYAEMTNKAGKDAEVKRVVRANGSTFLTPDSLKEPAKSGGKITVLCHNYKGTGPRVSITYGMPNEINLENGEGSVSRKDSFSIEGDEIVTEAMLETKTGHIKDSLSKTNTIIVTQENNHFTIRKSYKFDNSKRDITSRGTVYLSATYELKK